MKKSFMSISMLVLNSFIIRARMLKRYTLLIKAESILLRN